MSMIPSKNADWCKICSWIHISPEIWRCGGGIYWRDQADIKYRTDTEINGRATILGKIMSVYYPGLIFREDGCETLKVGPTPVDSQCGPLVSSGDGAAIDPTSEDCKTVFEIKGKLTDGHNKIPTRYTLQVLAEMDTRKCDTFGYFFHTPESSTFISGNMDTYLVNEAKDFPQKLYLNSEKPKKPIRKNTRGSCFENTIRRLRLTGRVYGRISITPRCRMFLFCRWRRWNRHDYVSVISASVGDGSQITEVRERKKTPPKLKILLRRFISQFPLQIMYANCLMPQRFCEWNNNSYFKSGCTITVEDGETLEVRQWYGQPARYDDDLIQPIIDPHHILVNNQGRVCSYGLQEQGIYLEVWPWVFNNASTARYWSNKYGSPVTKCDCELRMRLRIANCELRIVNAIANANAACSFSWNFSGVFIITDTLVPPLSLAWTITVTHPVLQIPTPSHNTHSVIHTLSPDHPFTTHVFLTNWQKWLQRNTYARNAKHCMHHPREESVKTWW